MGFHPRTTVKPVEYIEQVSGFRARHLIVSFCGCKTLVDFLERGLGCWQQDEQTELSVRANPS
jgi:hypothetical protein